MMAFCDKNASTEVVSDASPVGLFGAILVQGQRRVKRAVAFASHSLREVERCYSQTEKEAQAVVSGCGRFNLWMFIFSRIPGPIFSNRNRIRTRTRLLLFGHKLKSDPNDMYHQARILLTS